MFNNNVTDGDEVLEFQTQDMDFSSIDNNNDKRDSF